MSDASLAGCRRGPFAVNLLLSLRPGQWTKNLLIFAGLLFGRQLSDPRRRRSRQRRLRRVLRAVGRRLPHQRRLGPRNRSAASAQSPAAHRVGRAVGAGGARPRRIVLGAIGARRRVRAGLAVLLRLGHLPGAARALLRPAQAHRHHRRADDCDRLRAARGGRRGRRRRGHQPLAARLHDPAGAVHLARRSGGTNWCCSRAAPSAIGRFSANTVRTCSIR